MTDGQVATPEPRLAFLAALVRAQSALGAAAKSSKADRYRYADLDEVWSAIREPLAANGLCVLQQVHVADGAVTVTTRLCHVAGHEERLDLELPVAQRTAQGIGSAITYGRRYGIMALVGVSTDDDDDGQAAGAPPPPQPPAGRSPTGGRPPPAPTAAPASKAADVRAQATTLDPAAQREKAEWDQAQSDVAQEARAAELQAWLEQAPASDLPKVAAAVKAAHQAKAITDEARARLLVAYKARTAPQRQPGEEG
ncbi:MAG: ERF family protein [Myxococcaceae bacterium]|nr:ERF family protein [Myxococcaceae bacterium]